MHQAMVRVDLTHSLCTTTADLRPDQNCGSDLLDKQFRRYIRHVIGESQWERIGAKSRQQMMKMWEYSTKRDYNDDKPLYLIRWQEADDNLEVDTREGTIELTR